MVQYSNMSTLALKQLALMYASSNEKTSKKFRSKNNEYKVVSTMDSVIGRYTPYFTREFRMDVDNFYKLHNILKDKMKETFGKSNRFKTSTYFIPTIIRLSIAIRFFAGGDPVDLCVVHQVSRSSVYDSVWGVVD